MSITVKGYVIVSPTSPFRNLEENRLIVADTSYGSFGKTPVEAWKRFIGQSETSEFSRKVQYMHDRGYRIREATMTIEDDR